MIPNLISFHALLVLVLAFSLLVRLTLAILHCAKQPTPSKGSEISEGPKRTGSPGISDTPVSESSEIS